MTRYRLVACSDGPLSEGDIIAYIWLGRHTESSALEAALKGAGDAWISVSEKLPSAEEALSDHHKHAVLGWHAGLRARLIDHWVNIATNKNYTHWQPLPAPPSAKGEV